MNRIENLSTCTGCNSCYSICPENAITMQQNAEGFLYPSIEKSKCISCSKCEKTCPVLNKNEPEENKVKEALACINKDEEIRMQSSSGGVFTSLAEQIIQANGVVFGVKVAKDLTIIHGWTDSIEGLSEFRGSKYVQSAIGETYKECQEFLNANRKILFSGTPCQIAGLKSFLGKEYENLFTIDIICHGVPSPLVWKKYTEEVARKTGKSIVRTSFRRKDYGWKKFSLAFTFSDESEYHNTLEKDAYLQLFLRDSGLRMSCYNCNFKGIDRYSDITLADFWGVQNEIPEIDDDKGVSFVVVNSPKGKQLLNETSNCFMKIIQLEQGLKYNPSLIKSVTLPARRKSFFIDLHRMRFDQFVTKYTKDKMIGKVFNRIKRIIKILLLCIIKPKYMIKK